MQWLKRLIGVPAPLESTTMVEGFSPPWADSRPSLFRFLMGFDLSAEGRLPAAASTLPDVELVTSRSGSKLQWSAGALDGVLGHHSGESGKASVDAAMRLLEIATNTPSPEHVKDFYDLVTSQEVFRLVDPLIDAVRSSKTVRADRLHDLALWLTRESPDRAAVKMGIALLGLVGPPREIEVLMRLGLHDEFTLYVAVALANSLPEAEGEDALWSLARQVDGWGRIQLVERLSKSSRADIKAWLLREGYKNSVMYEYLAYVCAVGGGLFQALESDSIDPELLHGAGDLIGALLAGGPAQDISGYADGAKVVQRYLAHVARHESPSLDVYLVVSDIAQFVDDAERDWKSLASIGWTDSHRQTVSEEAATILSASQWPELALAALETDGPTAFWVAATAAERMGLDIWEKRFERQRDGRGDQWYNLMQTREAVRVDRVIELAMKQIDLRAIATGPGQELGLGTKFQQDSALGFILQDLGQFPGKGWPLVAAGLKSQVIRNRNMVLRVLGSWGVSHWPTEAAALLLQAHGEEPDDELRSRMAQLLAQTV